MPHYKDPKNGLHFIEVEHAHLLPAGAVQIYDLEADAIRESLKPAVVAAPEPTKAELTQQIAALAAKVEALP